MGTSSKAIRNRQPLAEINLFGVFRADPSTFASSACPADQRTHAPISIFLSSFKTLRPSNSCMGWPDLGGSLHLDWNIVRVWNEIVALLARATERLNAEGAAGTAPCAFRSPHEGIDETVLDRDDVCGAWELIGPASGWN
jgi:hypothetical protein